MKKLLLILFLFSSQLFSQEFHYNYFSEKEGLSSNNVYKVIQDKKGYLWFATASGVSRYDGVNFEEFSTEDGLSDYEVLSLFEDSKGRIWFETFNGKPSFYLNGKIHNPENNPLLNQVEFTRYIKNIFEDSSGNIWLGALNTACKINFQAQKVTTFKERVVFCIENENNEVLLYSGLDYYYNTSSNKKEFLQQNAQINYLNNPKAFVELNNKDIIYGNQSWLNYKKADEHSIFQLTTSNILKNNQHVISIYESLGEGFYLATNNGVVFINDFFADNIQDSLQRYLVGKNTTSVIKDHQGNIWITTTNGVYQLHANKNKKIPNLDANIISFSHSENHIISASANNTITLTDKKGLNTKILFESAIKPKKVIEKNKIYYIITNNGAYKTDGVETKPIFKSLSLKDLVIRNDNYYLADAGGVYKVPKELESDENFKFKNYLEKGTIKQLLNERAFYLKDYDTILFASTINGLYKIKHDSVSNVLPNNDAYKHRIFSIDKYNDSFVLGTEGNGLYIYKNDTLFKHYNAKNGLLSNQVRNTFVQNDSLFVVTKKGVQALNNAFEISQIETLSFKNLVVNQGLSINDTIFLATSEGILFTNNKSQPIYSTILSEINAVSDNTFIEQDELLSFTKEPINFNFKLFNYSNETINYEYKLMPIDNDWNNSFTSSISYQNLNPGTYSFQLRANGKIINSFNFGIKTPFWLQWWFIALMVLVLFLISYSIYKSILNKKIKKATKAHNINLMIAKAEQDALKAQMNPHFIFNALNAIQNLILQNKTETAYEYLGNFSKLVRTILNNSRNLTTIISNEITFLELYLKLESLRFSDKFSYEIISGEGLNKEQTIPSMIIQPFVENSIIHGLLPLTDAVNSNLIITFTEDENYIYCSIDDNGVGRKSNKKEKNRTSLGLKIIEERLELYDQQKFSGYNIVDKPNGTQVNLKIYKNVERSNS